MQLAQVCKPALRRISKGPVQQPLATRVLPHASRALATFRFQQHGGRLRRCTILKADEGRDVQREIVTSVETSRVAARQEPAHLNGSPNGKLKDATLIVGSDTRAVAVTAEEIERKESLARWRIVVFMAIAFVLCNMDKVNMSVAVIPMAAELGWTATERGLVSSSFFWGYSLTQLPAGWISTKIGGAKVLAAGVALWSFGTLIAPPAANLSIVALCASRVLVGLGEGFAPSAATAVLAKLVPATERSRAVTIVWGGLDVGSAFGLLLCGPLILHYGWPCVFYLFAVLGLVWCAVWPLVRPQAVTDEQALKRQVEAAAAEAALTGSTSDATSTATGTADKPEGLPWRAFFTSAPVWAVTIAHFCFNWGYYTLLAWLPSYFELALGMNVEKSSYLTLIPYVAMVLMTPLVGPIADGWVKSGVPLTRVRKICQGIAFIGPALCMASCAVLTPASAAAATDVTKTVLVSLLSLGFALGAWSRAGLYCNHQDLSPQYASALLGISNTAGALPGVLGVISAGHLLDMTSSWALALFYPTAACQLFGALIYSIFASSKRQPWS